MKDSIIETERLRIVPSGQQCLAAAGRENTAYMLSLPNLSVQETAVFLELAAQERQKDSPAFFEFALLYKGQDIGAVSVDLDGGICGRPILCQTPGSLPLHCPLRHPKHRLIPPDGKAWHGAHRRVRRAEEPRRGRGGPGVPV